MRKYCKPVRSNQELIELWESRELVIPNIEEAEHTLSTLCYYRLSAYALPFLKKRTDEQDCDLFKPGTSFDNILTLYRFDRELRLLVLDAIECIEIALRAQLCNVLCEHTKDPFWYMDKQYFDPTYKHDDFINKRNEQIDGERKRLHEDLEKIEKNSNIPYEKKQILKQKAQKENFIRHYISSYGSPALPPAWMMVEMLTFGELHRLYSGLKAISYGTQRKETSKQRIAESFNLTSKVFTSWIGFLCGIRNICAHHTRLWNRVHGKSPMIPTSKKIPWIDKNHSSSLPPKRAYVLFLVLRSLLYTINPKSTWAKQLYTLIEEKYPRVHKFSMGMTENWYEDPFWKAVLE